MLTMTYTVFRILTSTNTLLTCDVPQDNNLSLRGLLHGREWIASLQLHFGLRDHDIMSCYNCCNYLFVNFNPFHMVEASKCWFTQTCTADFLTSRLPLALEAI